MHPLELKIPPLAVVLITAFLMKLAVAGSAGLRSSFPMRGVVVAFFVLAGLSISFLGFNQFQRAKTTLNPTKPQTASSLVTSGIYTVTRNPMYLGFLLILAGWAIWLHDARAALLLPAFIFYLNRFQIKPEERALAARFGADFQAYCAKVRRWI